ncbi:Uncharacterised protein [Serratia fonticola]|uniref:Uncharacterized protein n=1 Tax=Serratia fonticola TaxID=47917 RepID=A0A448T7T3_SERFO|nr:Uncharacterised protein [Serratia fonticola]
MDMLAWQYETKTFSSDLRRDYYLPLTNQGGMTLVSLFPPVRRALPASLQ